MFLVLLQMAAQPVNIHKTSQEWMLRFLLPINIVILKDNKQVNLLNSIMQSTMLIKLK